jgi:metal-responsive CopG/Arc/MetJ family transcriptional regulator
MCRVAKKVFASVSDQLAEKLDKRAEIEGRSLSNLISYLLERVMEDWEPSEKQPTDKQAK